MGCGKYHSQLGELEKALNGLRISGLPGMEDSLRTIRRLQQQISIHPSTKFPRTILQLLKLVGLSPGSIGLFIDVEGGFMTAARTSDGARPVYRYVTPAIAATLISGGLDHELEYQLMAPDDYIGE